MPALQHLALLEQVGQVGQVGPGYARACACTSLCALCSLLVAEIRTSCGGRQLRIVVACYFRPSSLALHCRHCQSGGKVLAKALLSSSLQNPAPT